jgi:outer membrane biosynthesis protein TonB
MRYCLGLAAVVASLVSACASSPSGYDPKRYAGAPKAEPADPDTQPLPSEPKAAIPDPKSPVAAAPPPAPTPTPVPESPAAPSASVAKAAPPAKPAPTAAPAPGEECGSKENPCPMQRLMRGQMAGAQSAEALEAAFTKVAGLSPSGGWAWASIAKKGAELAKAGDVAGSKAQCKACHDQHKDAYKKQFRAKKL